MHSRSVFAYGLRLWHMRMWYMRMPVLVDLFSHSQLKAYFSQSPFPPLQQTDFLDTQIVISNKTGV